MRTKFFSIVANRIPLMLMCLTGFSVSAGEAGTLPGSLSPSFIVEEYRLIPVPESVGEYTADIVEASFANEMFLKKLRDAKQKRAKWRGPVMSNENRACVQDVLCLNEILKEFDYRIEKQILQDENRIVFNLFKGTEQVVSGLDAIQHFSLNWQGDRFVLFVYKYTEGINQKYYLVNEEGIDQFDSKISLPDPLFVENSLMSIVPGNERDEFLVKKEGRAVYSFTSRYWDLCGVVKAFFPFKNSWVIEYDDSVVADGEDIGRLNNFSMLFYFRILKERLFSFLKKDEKIQIRFDGKTMPVAYDEVIHYMCCEYALMNPKMNNNMVWFFAVKDGYLYYVEAGIYE